MALLAQLDVPTSLWRSELWPQILQLRQGEYREFSSWDVQLVSCFSNILFLICFLLITVGHF